MQLATMRAVFLHSGWRSGSTYFWSKFREHESCLGFYEPFNELLGSLTPAHVLLAKPAEAVLRHPHMQVGYFHEYLPMLSDKGHPLFRDDFPLRNYFASDEVPEQQIYIRSLLRLAEKSGKTPVLGFVRSLGRLPWFKRCFDAVNIVLIRSPFNQWTSGRRLAAEQGYRFFDPMHFAILSCAEGCAAVFRHAEHHAVPRLPGLPSAGVRYALHQVSEARTAAQRFEAFASVYFLSYMAALPHADLVVDMDRLSADGDYRDKVTQEVARLTDLKIDFSDAHAPVYRPDAASDVFAALKRLRREIALGRKPLWSDDVCGPGLERHLARALIHLKFSEDSDRRVDAAA